MKLHRIAFAIISFFLLIILLYAANAPFLNYNLYFDGSGGRPYQDITGLTMAGKEFSEIYYAIFIVFFMSIVATISRSLVASIISFVGTVAVAFYLVFFADEIYASAFNIEGVDKISKAEGGTHFLIILLVFMAILIANLVLNIIRVANKPVVLNSVNNIDSDRDLLDF
jgi:hypothetical protein